MKIELTLRNSYVRGHAIHVTRRPVIASVRDIAKEANVSIATVSRVLNGRPGVGEATRDRVRLAANGRRYVARVAARCTDNLAYVYTGERSLASPFDAALLGGVDDALELHGLRGTGLLVLDADRSREAGESFTQLFHRKAVRGALVRTTRATRHTCEELAAEGVAAVAVGDAFADGSPVSFVRCDSGPSSREAVADLIAMGHRRVAVAVNQVADADHDDRVAGWRRACRDAGLPAGEELIFRTTADCGGGRRVVAQLKAMRDPPTALYVADPLTAAGALQAAHELSLRVPGDLSLIGFDDGDLRHQTWPPMSAVVQDARALGMAAVAALAQLTADPSAGPIRRVLGTRYEPRGTAGPPG